MTKTLNVAMLGYGFMGKAHSNAYAKVGHFYPELKTRPKLRVLCGRDRAKAEAFAEVWGYESVETEWQQVLERDDVDLIDIGTPNATHAEIAISAAERGKWVACEKPLALNVAEAEAMTQAVRAAGVPNLVWYNYRSVPAVALAHRIVQEKRIGRPFHYRATYLQDWTISEDVPQGGSTLWRLDKAVAGSGVTGDLLAHSIDTAMWLNGPIRRVMATTETFVKERVHQASGELEPVEIDDACMFLAQFANGSMGTFESTRYARGRKNFNTLELNGEDGSLSFNLEDPQYLSFYEHTRQDTGSKVEDHLTGWRNIHVTNSEHPYMDHWWVPGCTLGYEHTFVNTLADFLRATENGHRPRPDFEDGWQTQKVCDAVLQSSREERWVKTGVKN